ncbi:hypothetical protein NKR23_g20 [Pleurostoma richardsiae]|uniref:Uncharacterized protein n=1 Tax=Pleurostoma richardsiae TaxID=41990 RepID=A0AA38VQL7_9PEZI|nr:hypothetical protein NKR23_g20 [Pleurostoma richardsiae]
MWKKFFGLGRDSDSSRGKRSIGRFGQRRMAPPPRGADQFQVFVDADDSSVRSAAARDKATQELKLVIRQEVSRAKTAQVDNSFWARINRPRSPDSSSDLCDYSSDDELDIRYADREDFYANITRYDSPRHNELRGRKVMKPSNPPHQQYDRDDDGLSLPRRAFPELEDSQDWRHAARAHDEWVASRRVRSNPAASPRQPHCQVSGHRSSPPRRFTALTSHPIDSSSLPDWQAYLRWFDMGRPQELQRAATRTPEPRTGVPVRRSQIVEPLPIGPATIFMDMVSRWEAYLDAEDVRVDRERPVFPQRAFTAPEPWGHGWRHVLDIQAGDAGDGADVFELSATPAAQVFELLAAPPQSPGFQRSGAPSPEPLQSPWSPRGLSPTTPAPTPRSLGMLPGDPSFGPRRPRANRGSRPDSPCPFAFETDEFADADEGEQRRRYVLGDADYEGRDFPWPPRMDGSGNGPRASESTFEDE